MFIYVYYYYTIYVYLIFNSAACFRLCPFSHPEKLGMLVSKLIQGNCLCVDK